MTITLSYRMIFFPSLEAVRLGPQPGRLAAHASRRRGRQGTLVGAVPCYAKSHSQGEYVFDHGWADAYERAGGDYYPKLQVAVPFTPAQGRRLLVRPGRAADAVRNALADSLGRHLQALERLLRPRHFPDRGGMADAGRARLSAAHAPAVPLDERRLRDLRRLPRRPLLAQAQDHPPRARRRAGERHHRRLADRLRPHRKRVGHVLRLLHGDRLAQMGPALSHALVLFHRRREDARQDPAGDGEAQRPLHRRRHQLHRLRHPVRPALGLHRAARLPALRALLLPGHPIRHRAQARPCRGRRRRLAQGHARLYADHDLFGALHRRSAAAAGDRRFPQLTSARM